MSKEKIEKQRKERISEALRRYYKSDKGMLQRNELSLRQRVKMSKYGEYLRMIDNNNERKNEMK